MDRDGVSIVIPALDEAGRLPSTLDRLVEHLGQAVGDPWEVVVSDDGSTDATASVVSDRAAADPRVRLVTHTVNRGKGAALVAGVDAASHPTVVLLDADLPVPVDGLGRLVAGLGRHDLLVGSRRLPGSRVLRRQPLVRRLGGRAYLLATRLLGFRAVSDPQCGVKVLRRDRVAPIMGRVTCAGFGFDIELVERCRRSGLSVGEVPVEWIHVPGSSLRPVRDALRTLRDLVVLRRRLRTTTGPAGSAPSDDHR